MPVASKQILLIYRTALAEKVIFLDLTPGFAPLLHYYKAEPHNYELIVTIDSP